MKNAVVALTGASGAPYGLRLCAALISAGIGVEAVTTEAARIVLQREAGISLTGGSGDAALLSRAVGGDVAVYGEKDLTAPFASGSSVRDAFIVCPCSMGTLGRISAGISGNLVERGADVALKEGRRLVLVPRETPLSTIHLENMLRLSRMGVRMVPAMPGFYGNPATVSEMVDFVVGKVLDVLGVENSLFSRWGGDA